MKIKIKNLYLIAIGILLAIIFLISKTKEKQTVEIDVTKDLIIGNINAKIKIIEYSSFDCPACAYFHVNFFENLKEKIEKNEVAIIFRPIRESNAKVSYFAILATLCVNEQNKLKEYMQELFKEKYNCSFNKKCENSWLFDIERFKEIAKDLNLNLNEFEKCLNSEKYKENVEYFEKMAIKDKIYATPTFLIIKNNEIKRIEGAVDIVNYI